MNIAFVNSTYKWGGVKTWLLDFAEGLKNRGHNVYIYGRQQQFVDAALQRVGHGEKCSFGPDLNPAAILRFYKHFTRNKVDVVFVNIGKDLATAGVAARLAGIPVVQQIGLPQDIPHRLKTTLLHRFIQPRFLCSCKFIQEGFLRSLPYLKPQDSHVVLTAKTVATYPIELHSPRVLVATQQLNPDKGHATLFKALARVEKPYTLHIAGTGSHEQALKELAQQLGIANNIVWHGFTNNIPGLLQQADIFLLASLSEGLPNTLQEALAAGLLPIIRNVGGVCEVISPALEPWVLPYQADDAVFAEAIQKALDLPDADLYELRAQARAACIQYCDLATKIGELEQWLEELLAKKTVRKTA